MEREYTESELRQKLVDKADQISLDLVGRLKDDNFFKLHSIGCSGTLTLDGEIVSDWEPFHRLFGEVIGLVIAELLPTILVALFEDDTA